MWFVQQNATPDPSVLFYPERKLRLLALGKNKNHSASSSEAPCLSLLFLPVHREHFPFFRTAPEAWKNTVRHNLCFRDSFEKVPVSKQGEASTRPRSCLWKLTEEGHRRFSEEARTLASTRLQSIQQCMSQPGVKPCPVHEPRGGGPEAQTLG